MTEWELFTAGLLLIAAHCRRCHRIASRYWEHDQTSGWEPAGVRNPCRCDPPPALPTGTELEPHLARARMRVAGRGTMHAPVTIRV